MMHDFQIRKRLILGVLGALLLADCALAYFNLRMATPRENREQSLVAQSRQMALVKADVKRATDIRAKIPQVLKEFDQFEATLLPASKGYSVVTQEMDEYARDARLILDAVKYHEKEVSGRNLTELTVESRVTGDYGGIVHFLNHLQRSKNVYIVDSLNVETDPSGQASPGVLRVNLRLKTYFRKV